MAKKILSKEFKAKQFKKGETGNPHGRPPISPIQRALRNLTLDTYREVIELVLTGNVEAVRAMIQDPKTPAIQVGVATAFMKAIKDGDYTVIERIAERIVGKIPDVVNVNAINNSKVAVTVSTLDPSKLKEAWKKLQEDV